MRRPSTTGALPGALIGLAASQVVSYVGFGTDDIESIADAEDLWVLYVIAGVVGVVVGAAVGAASMMAAAATARSTRGSAGRRRLLAAAAAAALCAVVALFVEPALGVLVPTVVVAVVGGLCAYALLPHVVDLAAAPAAAAADLPAWGSTTPEPDRVETRPLAPWRRALLTAVVAGGGGFVSAGVVASAWPAGREVKDVVAIVTLVVVGLGLAVVVWRGSRRLVSLPKDGRPGA